MALSAGALLETRTAFDGVAADYGRQNDENVILSAMRRRAMAAVIAHVPAGSHLLDLGCGPGADAATLARAGYRVTAIDASDGMVEQARQRVRTDGLREAVQVHRLPIESLDRLAPATFDAAYSNFGPLNCVPDLGVAARLLAARLKPGAPLIASVIGRVCPWELALFSLRRDWARARVRFAGDFVAVPLDGRAVWTRYYSAAAVTRICRASGFERVSLRALGLFVPPPYLARFAVRHPKVVACLQVMEDQAGAWPGLRACGDHFLIVLRRL